MLASRYAMERELGRGGMAVVYLARDLRHQRDVAVKVFPTEGAPAGIRDRFLHEIQVAARLAHPSILPVHDSGESAGFLYYVMPYVPGESLRERLDREGALPVTEALTIAAEVAGALAYAHSHGVVHRDIKPDNILLVAGHSVLADFGIARAMSASGWATEPPSAGADGTPTYMSPEEASGARVDGRSDVYSLGCVIYEMLTGAPPFQGRTPEELVVQHLESDPVPLHARRPSLSRELQVVVARALAKHPADRFQTAQQLADRLVRWIGQPPLDQARLSRPEVVAAAGEVPRVLRWAILLGLAAVGLFGLSSGMNLHQMTILGDPDRYLVTPFVQRDSALVGHLRGDQCARLLQQALTRWQDVSAVDSRLVADRVMQLGHAPALFDYERIAGEAKAGRVLAGEIYRVGDSIRVRGVLYDMRARMRPEREFTVTLGLSLEDADHKFATLADSLLLERAHTGLAIGGAMGTRVIAAWQAYDSGHVALASWDLTQAERQFQQALVRDPDYGLAHLWLAQTREWRGEPPEHWRDDASAGFAAMPPMSERDRSWALALAALGEGRYPEACDRYNSMLRADSLDFRGWYGRAECRALDHLVLPDPKSPTGWRWRASYQAAIRDFQRALTLVPSSHLAFRGAAFSRLSALFFSEPSMMRRGIRGGAAADPEATEFWAFPRLEHDTLAFYPVPFSRLVGLRSEVPPLAAVSEAIESGRRSLLAVTRDWVRAFPTSAEARASFGLALERAGELADGSVGADSVERQFSEALRYATDPDFRIRLAASQIRVMVKRGRFAVAGRLADSLLAANADPSIAAAPLLAATAALRGRAALAAALARRSAAEEIYWGPDGAVLQVPLPLRETALAFETYAGLGGPADSLGALERRARSELAGMIPEPERTTVGMALFDRGQSLLFPDTLRRPLIPRHTSMDYLFALQELVRDGKADEARRVLASIRDRRRNLRPTDIALEGAVQEFEIDLAVGDTAGATAGLDAVLGSGATQGSDLLERVAPTAALVRAMVLRARLGALAGDSVAVARFADAVRILWNGADPGLRDVVAEMRELSRKPAS